MLGLADDDFRCLRTDSANEPLRNLKDGTEVRAEANRSTIEALQKRRLIAAAKEGGVAFSFRTPAKGSCQRTFLLLV